MKTRGNGQPRSGRREAPPADSAAGSGQGGVPDVPIVRKEGDSVAVPPQHGSSREEKIAIIAYYKAQRRGFANSGELDDWLEAEREVDRENMDNGNGEARAGN